MYGNYTQDYPEKWWSSSFIILWLCLWLLFLDNQVGFCYAIFSLNIKLVEIEGEYFGMLELIITTFIKRWTALCVFILDPFMIRGFFKKKYPTLQETENINISGWLQKKSHSMIHHPNLRWYEKRIISLALIFDKMKTIPFFEAGLLCR